MATLPNLVEAIACCDGRDRSTLDQFARVIREAGYVQTGKRGRGAADMTPSDAVSLLLGMNGADTPSGGPEAVRRFRSLRTGTVKIAETCDVPALTAIKDTQNFGQALEVLVSGFNGVILAAIGFMKAGFSEEKIRDWNISRIRHRNWDTPLNMEVRLRRYHAEIILRSWVGDAPQSGGHFNAQWRTEFYADFLQDIELVMQDGDFYGENAQIPARAVTVSINARMLSEIWCVLYGTEPSE